MDMELIIVVFLVIGYGIYSYWFYQKIKENHNLQAKNEELNNKYGDFIEKDKILSQKETEIKILESQHRELSTQYTIKKNIYDKLVNEVNILEENLETLDFGLYKPHFDFATSELYKEKIEQNYENQKNLIKQNGAVFCPSGWTVNGSVTEGRKMIKQGSKVMLRAFNAECDAAIAKVRWNNVNKMEERIKKAFESLNASGTVNQLSITIRYLELKLEELYLTFEHQEKIYQEKEEQKRIREELKEQEKTAREIQKVIEEAELEEKRYSNLIEKTKKELEKAKGEEINQLNEKIKLLESRLRDSLKQKEEAKHRAEVIKSGYIYVISNIGSFGEDIFKIGMTRRLEPQERVKELGDASVPFSFDIHALVYSENAPELENKLHKILANRKVNMINERKEFFKTSLQEIKDAFTQCNIQIEINQIPEAKEYRQSLAQQLTIENKTTVNNQLFPSNI